jgi:Defence against restriction A N-terminal
MSNFQFEFDELKPNPQTAPKSIIRAFTRAGATVASSWVDGKNRRENSISFKEINLIFGDGQAVVLRVKQTGDIFQVKLNGIAVPIKKQDDHAKAFGEVVNMLEANRTKWQKKMAALKVDMPTGLKSTVTRKEDALASQEAEVDKAIAEAESELASLKTA